MSEDLGAVGRVREGRVDTGTPVFKNEDRVSAELIRRALTNAGFGLDDAHWFTKNKPGSATKFVVSLAFSVSDAPITEFNRETTEAFRELAKTVWFCHVWLNPNGVLTINFVSIQDKPALQNLTVRDLHLALVPATGGEARLGIPLDSVRIILVKFFFTNPKRIPAGIKRIERPSDEEMDKRHATQVGGE
ncbi:hypothetical protein KW790_02885 [Candidatus Parcubacteria bacterium]|nr:hypothetical protein [Candidatus Parcubacteria bacterium]